MTELQIKAAAKRLVLETELDEAVRALEEAKSKVSGLQAEIITLDRDPEEYFRIEARIQQLIKNTQQ